MRKSIVLGSSVTLGVISFFGCTAILGDFEVRPGAGGDGGPDVGTTDGPAGGDGSDDGPPGPRELKCAYNAAKKREIARTLPGEMFDRPLQVFRVGQNAIRVTLQSRMTSGGANGVKVFTFDADSGGSGPPPLNVPADGPYIGARRVANGIGMMVGYSPATPNGTWSFGVAVAPDADFGSIFSPSFDVVQNIPQGGPGGRIKGSWVELAQEDYYFAMSYASTASQPTAIAGRARRNPATNPGVLGAFDFSDMLSLIPEAGSIFYFLSGDPNAPTSGEIWRLPDDGTVPPGNYPKHSIAAQNKIDLLMGATRSSVDTSKIDMAVLEIGQGALAPDLKVGQIPPFALETTTAAVLPKAYGFNALDELPVDKGGFVWTGDDWLMIGGPGDTVPGFRGFNFLWVDATGHVRGKILGQANALLKDVQNQIVGVAATKKPGGLDIVASIDLVWVEQIRLDAGGDVQTLNYATIGCSP